MFLPLRNKSSKEHRERANAEAKEKKRENLDGFGNEVPDPNSAPTSLGAISTGVTTV
jgi:hypothetical protein